MTTTQAEALREAIEGRVAMIHTGLAAKVISYDRATQKATVQPVVRFRRIDPDTDELVEYTPPPIPGVPVAFPSTSAGSLTFDISAGDLGWLTFGERSHADWLATGTEDVAPQDVRRHALSDAVFLPGVRPFSDPLPAAAYASGAVVLRGDDVRLGDSTATDFVALASLVLSELQSIKAAYDSHTHAGVTAGAGVTATPLPLIPAPGSVAADRVRAT